MILVLPFRYPLYLHRPSLISLATIFPSQMCNQNRDIEQTFANNHNDVINCTMRIISNGTTYGHRFLHISAQTFRLCAKQNNNRQRNMESNK